MPKNKKRKKKQVSDAMPDRGTPEYFAIRSRNARNNVLLFLIITVINIAVLYAGRFNALFSAWFPYWQVASGTLVKAGIEGITAGSPILAAVCCAALLAVFLLWKKHWLVSAVFGLLAVADTVYLAVWIVLFWSRIGAWGLTFSVVLTAFYHVMILFYAWTGLEAEWNLKK